MKRPEKLFMKISGLVFMCVFAESPKYKGSYGSRTNRDIELNFCITPLDFTALYIFFVTYLWSA